MSTTGGAGAGAGAWTEDGATGMRDGHVTGGVTLIARERPSDYSPTDYRTDATDPDRAGSDSTDRAGCGAAEAESNVAGVLPATPAPSTRLPTRDELIADTSECEALEELGDEIATLSGHIASLECERLVKIAEFDRRGGWLIGGYRNCADWLACRTGLSAVASRERVRVAGALVELPVIRGAMGAGRLSFSKVRAVTRVATPENEADLVEFAQDTTAAQLETMVRGWKLMSPAKEEERERRRHAARTLSVVPDPTGMYRVHGSLPPEVGALLMRAIEAASDALYEVERAEALDDETTPAQRRADAIGLLAERAMAVGFEGCEGPSVSAETEMGAERGPERKAGPVELEVPISGTRAERYQVVMHMDLETLQGMADGAAHLGPTTGSRSDLADGTRVSAETIRRFLCDGSVVPMVWGPDGTLEGTTHTDSCGTDCCAPPTDPARTVLNVGRKRRTIPPALRRALHARDAGCRFPGCGLRFCEGHHIVHWVVGGETKLSNLVLLCRHHHRLVHDEGFRVERRRDGSFKFFSPEGLPIGPGRPSVDLRPGDPAARIIQARRRKGVRPDPLALGARWEKEHHIPTAKLFRVLEAMG